MLLHRKNMPKIQLLAHRPPIKILLLDDEINPGAEAPDMDYMWHYAKALEEAGHLVTAVNRADDALRKLKSKKKRFSLVVLDIMMPPGRALVREPHLKGMRTGIRLGLKLSKEYPKLSIVILTNSRDPEIQRCLGSIKNVRAILWKDQLTPFEFVESVTPFLSGSDVEPEKP
jgi:CheY-like chemotaxis protein